MKLKGHLSTAFILLSLAIIHFEHANAAWDQIFAIGTEEGHDGSGRWVLEKKNFAVKTRPNTKTERTISFNGNGRTALHAAYIARLNDKPKLKYNEDYFVSVISGGPRLPYVTFAFQVKENPSNEPMNFEVQIITYTDPDE